MARAERLIVFAVGRAAGDGGKVDNGALNSAKSSGNAAIGT
jgi:hypothetical protein